VRLTIGYGPGRTVPSVGFSRHIGSIKPVTEPVLCLS